jgi:hypothetical protein
MHHILKDGCQSPILPSWLIHPVEKLGYYSDGEWERDLGGKPGFANFLSFSAHLWGGGISQIANQDKGQ